MRAFLAVIVKDLRVRFSSRSEIVFFLVLPIVFTLVLSGSTGAPARAARAPVVLVEDRSGSAAGPAFVSRLRGAPGLAVRMTADPTDLIRSSEADVLLVLDPPGSPGSPISVSLRLSPWRSTARETARRLGELLRGADPAAAMPDAGSAAAPDTAAARPPVQAGGGAVLSNAAIGSAGQIVTWVLVPLLGLGSAFVSERRRGTLRRTLASPARRSAVTAGKAAAEVLAALVQIRILVFFGSRAFHLPFDSHPLELAAVSVAFCAAGAALGGLIGLLCTTERQAGSLALALSMVLAVLGGCWYPAALFPSFLRGVSHALPSGWAMDGLLAVLTPGSGPAAALLPAAALALFAAAVLGITALLAGGRGAAAA